MAGGTGGVGSRQGGYFEPVDPSKIPDDQKVSQKGEHKGSPVSNPKSPADGTPLQRAKAKGPTQEDLESQKNKPLPDIPQRKATHLATNPRPQLTRPAGPPPPIPGNVTSSRPGTNLQRPDRPAPKLPEGAVANQPGVKPKSDNPVGTAIGVGAAQHGAGLSSAMEKLYSYQMGMDVSKTIEDNVVMLSNAKTPEDQKAAQGRIEFNATNLKGIVDMISKKRDAAPEGSDERAKLDGELKVLSQNLEKVNSFIEGGFKIEGSGYTIPKESPGKQSVLKQAKTLIQDLDAKLQKAPKAVSKSVNDALDSLKSFVMDDILSFDNLLKVSDLLDKLEDLASKITSAPGDLKAKISSFISNLSSASTEAVKEDNNIYKDVPKDIKALTDKFHDEIEASGKSRASKDIAHKFFDEAFDKEYHDALSDIPDGDVKKGLVEDFILVQYNRQSVMPTEINNLYKDIHKKIDNTNLNADVKAKLRPEFNKAFFGKLKEVRNMPIEDQKKQMDAFVEEFFTKTIPLGILADPKELHYSSSIKALQAGAHDAINSLSLADSFKEDVIDDFNKAFATKYDEVKNLPQEWQQQEIKDFTKEWLQTNVGITGNESKKYDDAFFDNLLKDINDLPDLSKEL